MARDGVAHTPQEQALFQDLTVRDNLRLGLPTIRHSASGSAVYRVPFFEPRLPQQRPAPYRAASRRC